MKHLVILCPGERNISKIISLIECVVAKANSGDIVEVFIAVEMEKINALSFMKDSYFPLCFNRLHKENSRDVFLSSLFYSQRRVPPDAYCTPQAQLLLGVYTLTQLFALMHSFHCLALPGLRKMQQFYQNKLDEVVVWLETYVYPYSRYIQILGVFTSLKAIYLNVAGDRRELYFNLSNFLLEDIEVAFDIRLRNYGNAMEGLLEEFDRHMHVSMDVIFDDWLDVQSSLEHLKFIESSGSDYISPLIDPSALNQSPCLMRQCDGPDKFSAHFEVYRAYMDRVPLNELGFQVDLLGFPDTDLMSGFSRLNGGARFRDQLSWTIVEITKIVEGFFSRDEGSVKIVSSIFDHACKYPNRFKRLQEYLIGESEFSEDLFWQLIVGLLYLVVESLGTFMLPGEPSGHDRFGRRISMCNHIISLHKKEVMESFEVWLRGDVVSCWSYIKEIELGKFNPFARELKRRLNICCSSFPVRANKNSFTKYVQLRRDFPKSELLSLCDSYPIMNCWFFVNSLIVFSCKYLASLSSQFSGKCSELTSLMSLFRVLFSYSEDESRVVLHQDFPENVGMYIFYKDSSGCKNAERIEFPENMPHKVRPAIGFFKRVAEVDLKLPEILGVSGSILRLAEHAHKQIAAVFATLPYNKGLAYYALGMKFIVSNALSSINEIQSLSESQRQTRGC